MTDDARSSPQSERMDRIERVLAEHGHDLGVARARLAADRTGVAIGFPADPIIHVSWWILLASAVLMVITRRARR